MNGIHDLGGMHGFGAIERDENEPAFHAGWEGRTFAIVLATMASRYWNAGELRRSIERMPPARYLTATYYERWLYALEALLLEKNLLSREEIAAQLQRLGQTETAVRAAEAPGNAARANRSGLELAAKPTNPSCGRSAELRHDPGRKARFKPGDVVIARNINPQGHTRLPRYARGRRGVVRRDWGAFVFPDTHAHGLGANLQHCYAVEFSGRELWGDEHDADEFVYIDLWEDYLADGKTADKN